MWVWSARAAILAFAVIGWAGVAAAGELADFNAAVEVAAAHNRVTLGYLRTGNTDLAAVELQRLRRPRRRGGAQVSRITPAGRRRQSRARADPEGDRDARERPAAPYPDRA